MSPSFTYIPLVSNRKVYSPSAKFQRLLAEIAESSDKFKNNYTIEQLTIPMLEYGYVENSHGDIVYMAGAQDFGDGMIRVESRTYVPSTHRTKYWNSETAYEVAKVQLEKTSRYSKFYFKSRESINPNGHLRSAKLCPELYSSWTVHPKKIELRYLNNWQWVMYGPTDNPEYYIKRLEAK